MNPRLRIAVIGLSPLEAIGAKSLVHSEADATVDTFEEFPQVPSIPEKYDVFIVASAVFAANPDFFMPRRQRLLVVDSSGGASSGGSGPPFISRKKDETEIASMIRKLISSINSPEETPGDLSNREKEVIRLIAAGKINKEIADRLCISINTVITHRKNISAKLGIKSASGLSLYAMMNGLI